MRPKICWTTKNNADTLDHEQHTEEHYTVDYDEKIEKDVDYTRVNVCRQTKGKPELCDEPVQKAVAASQPLWKELWLGSSPDGESLF
ncbi:hypothetical protein NPIL_192281 [Nephila pilipes]|uniref:Uncharacterized protein n=1 Tax=Nephila pilipes TaxID=299642 RepID=A0A8X6QD89_NEPPI|nr:hypothetical protein NPIL_192281 [Nephila pilipes]